MKLFFKSLLYLACICLLSACAVGMVVGAVGSVIGTGVDIVTGTVGTVIDVVTPSSK
jgi:hypothetical protein